MKQNKLIVILIFLFTSVLTAQVPSTLSWQGILQDDSGDLLDGQYTITTKIYDAQTGGNALWTESQTVTIEDGITNLILGKSTTLNLDFEDAYWLEITIDNGTPLSRIELTSVPYAFTSKNIEDKAVTYDKLQDANGNSGTILMWNGTQWTESDKNDSDAVIGNEVIGNADGTLVRSGSGTAGDPYKLKVALLGIDTQHLADDAVTTDKIDDYTILEEDIKSDQVVFSIGEVDRIKNDVYLVEGPNIRIDDNTPLDGDIKISAIIPNIFNANFVIVNNIGDTVAIFKNDSVVINKNIYIYGKSYHYDTEYFFEGIEHPLEGGGKLVINQDGLFIYNEAGDILIRFDENGSLHNVPETYNDDITRNHPDGSTTKIDDNGITQKSADGKKTTTSTHEGFTTSEELEDGTVNETENTPTGTKNKTTDPEGNEIVKTNLGQDEDGNGMLAIYDKDGNLIFKVDKDGSYHYVKEYFYQGTVVQNEDGSEKAETNPDGVTVTKTAEDGSKTVSGVDATGNHTTGYDSDGNLLGGTESGVESDGSGYIAVYDENGNLIYYIDGTGSYHYVPEYYYGNIEVQDEEENSTTTVTPEGTTTEDHNTDTKTTTTSEGLEVTAPGLLGLENTISKIGADEDGNGEIEINDANGNTIFRVDDEASHHYVPEYYYGGIYSVEVDLWEWLFEGNKGKITDLTTGEEIVEMGEHPVKPGGFFSVYDNDAETNTSSGLDEDGFEATGDDGNTLAKIGQNEDGSGEIKLYDSEGNIIFQVDELGSYHNVTEHFREGITVGNDDYDATDGSGWNISPYGFLQFYMNGNPFFDFNPETGLTLYDYEGNVTSQFTPWGSTHNTNETFNEGITIPTATGGNIKLDENGIEIEDEYGNTKTKFNNDGTSEHYGLETYHSGIDIPSSEGGSIDILPPDAPLPGLALKGPGEIVKYEWDLDSWDSHLPTTFHSDVTHNGDVKLQTADPENPPSLQLADSFFDIFFEINNNELNSSIPLNLTGNLNSNATSHFGQFMEVNPENSETKITGTANENDFELVLGDGSPEQYGALITDKSELRSDRRFKENITPLSDILPKLIQLNGYNYNRKGFERKEIGLIAQEIEVLFPELVSESEKGYKSVAYSRFVAVLLEAVKEQQKQIDELNKRIETQNSQIQLINNLKSENEKLNSQMQNLYRVINEINTKLEEEKNIKTVKLNSED